MRIVAIIAAGLALALGGAAQPAAAPPVTPPATDAGLRAACVAEGGTPRGYGATERRRWFCERVFADAGKTCRARSDCMGDCTLPDDYKWYAGTPPLTVGTCEAVSRVGCMNVLRDGMPVHFCQD